MQNNPDDDVMNSIVKKVVEDILRTLPEAEGARIIGYTVITGTPGATRRETVRFEKDESPAIPYEIVDAEDTIYITATLPANHENAPFADINPGMVRICVDDKVAAIDLPELIDVIHSSYEVRRGIMDITLKKAKKPESYLQGPVY